MFQELPLNYLPYRELVLCGNTLNHVRIPIAVNKFPVFLVGSSPNAQKIMVWLAAPLNKETNQWRFVIEGGLTMSPHIRLIHEKSERILKVHIGQTLILEAEEMSPDKAIIRTLDLRPLGLSIFGDQASLHVGTHTLAQNTFSNVDTMIAIG